MRLAFRFLATSLVTIAVVMALRVTPVLAYRCYIDDVTYYEDETCTNQVGAVARGCNGQIVWQWGDQTAYWDQVIDGGFPICGCGQQQEYHSYNPGTCGGN